MKRSREPEEAHHEEVALAGLNTAAPVGDSHISPPAAKIAGLDLSSNDGDRNIEMHCSLPPHKEAIKFSSYDAYEAHYRDQHTNRCAQCRKNFPSAHLVGLHIEEIHDSFVQVRREKGERTYSCFVDGCDRKCSTPQKRKMHLIDKHMYPKNFFFAITREGIDGRRSLLLEDRGRGRRQQKSSTAPASRPGSPSQSMKGHKPETVQKPTVSTDGRPITEVEQKNPDQRPDEDMEDLSNAMSSLRFVPMSVRFGRGGKAGFAKR
ncbi:hypothetical protein CHGG_03296 [Chaetomium globosum CBS 148.51]|uniref:C2H2-type domain-containing protein n=1 Tax=Chaetomium globosum (strain ATCC 6205 / CBS 148.51 / DSM 1962 / NBRC 6347 / NRRL 1970) TaxID=306901 RepID=Q2H908_CHAGB|nr:uncharacterized protein CHGG_03296 [Chaetomium globosum CBS 148.51]EAQ91361.1 hypothetical protein CHGG_03296 [Chaetomium globosum CBS 148.51]